MNKPTNKNITLTYAWKKGSAKNFPRQRFSSYESFEAFTFRWFKASIESAKKQGYKVELYSDSEGLRQWDSYSLLDNLHEVPKDFYPLYFDSYKWYPQYTRDDVINIDHDIIMHHRLPSLSEDVIGDAMIERYENVKKDLDKYEKIKIEKVFPEWSYIRTNKSAPSLNTGFLRFNNKDLKKLFFDRWGAFHDRCLNTDISNNTKGVTSPTIMASETMIGILSLVNDYSMNVWNKTSNDNYYTHYVGDRKFTEIDILASNSIL